MSARAMLVVSAFVFGGVLSVAHARPVKKIDDNYWRCNYSDGTFTNVTAGTRKEARDLCDAAAPLGATLDSLHKANEAQPTEETK